MDPRKPSVLLTLMIAFAGPAVLIAGPWFLFFKADKVPIPRWIFFFILFGIIVIGASFWFIGEIVKPKEETRPRHHILFNAGLEPESNLIKSFRVLMPWKSVAYYELARLNGILAAVVCFGLIENPSIWMTAIFLAVFGLVVICAYFFYKQHAVNP